ncbi:hypothetical protein HDU67_000346 [Dinochytrium kinnereticum]|nr:hypothetical protein HDU67_000346 [Dinochytrium kinnereticum]
MALSELPAQIDTQRAIVESLMSEYKHHFNLAEEIRETHVFAFLCSNELTEYMQCTHRVELFQKTRTAPKQKPKKKSTFSKEPDAVASPHSKPTNILDCIPSREELERIKCQTILDALSIEERKVSQWLTTVTCFNLQPTLKLADLNLCASQLEDDQTELSKLFQEVFSSDSIDARAVNVLKTLKVHLEQYRTTARNIEEAKKDLKEVMGIVEGLASKIRAEVESGEWGERRGANSIPLAGAAALRTETAATNLALLPLKRVIFKRLSL